MIFEREQDLERERLAVEKFVSIFKGSYKKLDQFDVDFKIFDKDRTLIAYAEVRPRNKDMSNAYPLPVSLEKISKLISKRLNPVVVWACADGIIYGKVYDLLGEVKKLTADDELMIYYPKQKGLKYLNFT